MGENAPLRQHDNRPQNCRKLNGGLLKALMLGGESASSLGDPALSPLSSAPKAHGMATETEVLSRMPPSLELERALTGEEGSHG